MLSYCLVFEGWQFLGWSTPLSFCQQACQWTLCQQCNVCYFQVCLECRISRNSRVLPNAYWWSAETATSLIWETVTNKHAREKTFYAHLLVILSVSDCVFLLLLVFKILYFVKTCCMYAFWCLTSFVCLTSVVAQYFCTHLDIYNRIHLSGKMCSK